MPLELSSPPENLRPLTSVSLVGIFGTGSAYTVVSANYETDGDLGSFRIDEMKGGDWISGYTTVGLKTPTGMRLANAALKRYGIPIQINIPNYLHVGLLPLSPVALPEELILLNQHYGHNKIIRVDRLQNGARHSSQFLRPPLREEEKPLDSACEAQFTRQRTLGQRTVE